MSVAANTSSQHNPHERCCQYEQPARPRKCCSPIMLHGCMVLLLIRAASTSVYALALRALKPRLITCNKLYNKSVQAFEVTPYEVRATSISTSVYALALGVLKPRLIPCNKLYNPLYRSFGVTSYPVLRAIRQMRTGLWMQHFASHEFTLEGCSELCYLAPQVRCVSLDRDLKVCIT